MHSQLELFKKDVESLQEELMSVSSMDTSQISLYEYFHISPIKVYLFHSTACVCSLTEEFLTSVG